MEDHPISRRRLKKACTIVNTDFKNKELIEDVLTTPYEKILRILHDIEEYLSKYDDAKILLVRLKWVVSMLISHSVYSYEIIKEKDAFDKIKENVPEAIHFANFVDPDQSLISALNFESSDDSSFKRLRRLQTCGSIFKLNTPSSSLRKKDKTKTITPFNLENKNKATETPENNQRSVKRFQTTYEVDKIREDRFNFKDSPSKEEDDKFLFDSSEVFNFSVCEKGENVSRKDSQ
ncbi:MAG: hypothetical protein MJ252_10995, partial [archaeon]|nr:hypothetical protein [archaeon]